MSEEKNPPKKDMRRFNGGHSTKATKRTDKRMKQMKNALLRAGNPTRVTAALVQLYDIGMDKNSPDRVAALKCFLEYAVGKPRAQVDITSNGQTTGQTIVQILPPQIIEDHGEK